MPGATGLMAFSAADLVCPKLRFARFNHSCGSLGLGRPDIVGDFAFPGCHSFPSELDLRPGDRHQKGAEPLDRCDPHRFDARASDCVDGGEKEVHFGGQKRASAVVTLWPRRGLKKGGAMPCLLFGCAVFGAFLRCAIRLAFDLEDDGSLDQTIQESHGQRAVGQILPPFVEVHVGDQSRGAFLIA